MTNVTIENNSRSKTPALVLKWIAFVCIVALSIWAGLRGRVWQFTVTEPTHFFSDETRNWLWGQYTYKNIHDKGRSFLDTYDDVGIQDRGASVYTDYAPLRMAVFTLWAASDEHAYPDRRFAWPDPNFKSRRDFHAFYVDFNAAMELIGAAGVFVLVRAVERRARDVRINNERWWTFTGVGVALVAALIIWFNPAMWLSAHSWPDGDSWIIPPFVWACYFCVRRCWFSAGVVLAIGALFKGQQFIIAPVFILWPLFQGRPGAALHFVCGLIAAFGIATAGWTLTYIGVDGLRHVSGPAAGYVVSLVLAVTVLPVAQAIFFARFTGRRNAAIIRASAIVACIFALAWPVLLSIPTADGRRLASTMPINHSLILAMMLIGIFVVCFARRRDLAVAAAALAGTGALLSMPLFGTCFAWFDAGYLFGPGHWEYMVMGLTSNLPGIMQRRFGWDGDGVINTVQTTIHLFGQTIDITLRRLLFWIFCVLLVISSAGIAMHDRRRSTRLLIAICTPWLLFFCIPAQIHERYLLFGAAVAAVCIGDSVGMALLGIFLSAVTWIMTMSVLNNNPWQRMAWDKWLAHMYPAIFAPDTQFAHVLQRFVLGTFPDIGWAVLLATAIFFYFTVTPIWVRRRRVVAAVEALPIIEPRTLLPVPAVLPQRDRPLPPLESIPLE